MNIGSGAALLAFLVILAVAAVPVFSHHFVSMNDVYNHVARAPVLAHYDSVSAYQQYWRPNWRLVPYLSYDLASISLLPWFSLGMIVKLMVAATLASLLGGAMLLSRAVHGRWSVTALISALFLVNRTLLAGFINYLFGIGVVLMGAAAWIAMRERRAALRLLVLAAFATTLSVIHLFACGVLGLVVVGIELADWAERRASFGGLVKAVLQPVIAFIPAFLLVIFVAPHPAFHIAYRGLGSRLGAFAVPLTYAPVEEAVGFLAIAVALLALLATGRLRIDRRLVAAAALLTLVQLAIPSDFGNATVVDHRIPIAVWLVMVCAIEARVERAAFAAGFVALIGVVFVSRVAIIQNQWTRDNVVYREAELDLASLPGTARVAAAYPATGLNSATRPDVALYYMPAFEFVPRGGFTQILWTLPDQHPLVMRRQFRQLTEDAPPERLWQVFVPQPGSPASPGVRNNALAALRDYDYIAFLDAAPFQVSPMNLLEPVTEGPGIRIYRVVHPSGHGGREQVGSATPRPDHAGETSLP